MISNGPSSLTPRVASTSEAPDIEETRRLPCLATLTPAPAAIRAAQVETLKVPWLSPPVPTISTASSGTATRCMRARSICAAPVISSTVSPRTLSAIRKAPICAGVAAPAVIWSSAVRLSSSLQVAPGETFWVSWRNSCEGWRSMAISGGVSSGATVATSRSSACQFEEVGEQRMAMLGGDAFGMELHAMHRVPLVRQPHDQSLAGGGDDEIVGQTVAINDQGMIARHLELLRQRLEHAGADVANGRELAMHRLRRAHDAATIGLANGLMAEAHAEDWNRRAHRSDQLQADAGLVWRARTGRQYDALGCQLKHIGDGNLVVAVDLTARPKLAQEVDEIVGKAVVVIDQHQHRRGAILF